MSCAVFTLLPNGGRRSTYSRSPWRTRYVRFEWPPGNCSTRTAPCAPSSRVEIRARARRRRAPRRRAPARCRSRSLAHVTRTSRGCASRRPSCGPRPGRRRCARRARGRSRTRARCRRDAERAVDLDRAVDEPQHHVGDVELDQRDLIARACEALVLDRPRGVQHHQARRVDLGAASAIQACTIWRGRERLARRRSCGA